MASKTLKNGLERRTIRLFWAETLFTSDAQMISCVMRVVFVKTERCATGADHRRGFCWRFTEGKSRSHQSLDLVVSRFLLSLFDSNNSAVAERHIMTKLVMMGSRRDYNPTHLISTTQKRSACTVCVNFTFFVSASILKGKRGIYWHVNLAAVQWEQKKMRLSVKLLRNDLTGESGKLEKKNSQRSTEKKETWPLSED